MKNFVVSAALALAAIAIPTHAAADNVADRNDAIRLCRAAVSEQAGEGRTVRLDQVRVRAASIRVDLDVWTGGNLQNVRCDVARNQGELTIASITPALQTASAE